MLVRGKTEVEIQMLIISIILSIVTGLCLSIYITSYLLDRSNNLGDFSGNINTLSNSGIVYTNQKNRVKEKAPIDYYYPGCPFKINGR